MILHILKLLFLFDYSASSSAAEGGGDVILTTTKVATSSQAMTTTAPSGCPNPEDYQDSQYKGCDVRKNCNGVYDCSGKCVTKHTVDFLGVDVYCDDGSNNNGPNLNCALHNYDADQCAVVTPIANPKLNSLGIVSGNGNSENNDETNANDGLIFGFKPLYVYAAGGGAGVLLILVVLFFVVRSSRKNSKKRLALLPPSTEMMGATGVKTWTNAGIKSGGKPSYV